MENLVEKWENNPHSADFESHDQHQRFLVWMLNYKKNNKEAYEKRKNEYKTFSQFKQDFLIPLFFQIINS